MLCCQEEAREIIALNLCVKQGRTQKWERQGSVSGRESGIFSTVSWASARAISEGAFKKVGMFHEVSKCNSDCIITSDRNEFRSSKSLLSFKKRATTCLFMFCFLKDMVILVNRKRINKSVTGHNFQKASSVLVCIYRNRAFRVMEALVLLCSTWVRPHVNHCIQCWLPHLKGSKIIPCQSRTFMFVF